MSTRYYICQEGQQAHEGVFFGKCAGGWTFAVKVDETHTSLEDWQKEWSKSGNRILSEHGEEIRPEEMLNIILNRSTEYYYGGLVHMPYAERGPGRLLRLKKCDRVSHAPNNATYDLCSGNWE